MPRLLVRCARSLAICLLLGFSLLVISGSTAPEARVLWVNADRSIFKISPVDGTPELELAALPDVQALAVDETEDRLWVYSHKHLWAYDPQGMVLVNEPLPHNFHGDEPAGMVADGAAGKLWIGIHRKLYRFDLSGHLQAALDLDHGIRGLTLDPGRSRVWVAEPRALVALDKAGNRLFSVPLEQRPDQLAYDAHLDQLWVVSGHSVARWDAGGKQVFAAKVSGDIDDHLAPDGQGGLWLAGDRTLGYLDSGGNLAFSLAPFASEPRNREGDERGHKIVDLVADPLNHTALGGRRALPRAIRNRRHPQTEHRCFELRRRQSLPSA